jgi:hypothetical protein
MKNMKVRQMDIFIIQRSDVKDIGLGKKTLKLRLSELWFNIMPIDSDNYR